MFTHKLGHRGLSAAGRSTLGRAATLLALAACALLPAQAQQAPGRSLTAVDFTTLDGDRVELTLTLSDAAPQPAVFAIDKPARLSVDLPDTHLALTERYRKAGVGQLRSIAAVEAQGRTRVVLELSQPTAYNVNVSGNKVVIDLAGSAAATSANQSAPALQTAAASISKIDFRRGEKGEGRVLVSLSDPRAVVDVHEEAGKIVARFRNTSLPERLSKRLDVLDFATPVKYVDAQRDGVDTRLVVTPGSSGDFEQVAYQAGDQFVLELQPLSQEKLAEKQREQPQFTGERISLSFQSVDVRALLQIIADVAGTNMVVSDTVNGQIAMRLQNVPWDQALDIILRTKGLAMRRQGNVMLVAPVEEIAARERAEAEADKQKVELAPLHSEIIQVNYAKATDLGNLMRNKQNSILSDRGVVTVDDRTNSLLVLDTRDKLAEVRALIQKLDVPVRQVLIESRIVVASDNFEKDLGVQWGATTVGTLGNNFLTTGGSNTGTDATTTSYTSALINGANSYTATTPSGSNYNVNLPAPVSAGVPASFALSLLSKHALVDLELSALQTEGKGEVVSSPRVITANAKAAVIKQGVEIPYQASTSSGATSVSFKDAVLSLNVTPQITPDGRINMDLQVHDDSVGSNISTGTGGSTPSIDTREVDTSVLVDNGQTVVLGGIFQQTASTAVSKVPMLGDLPVLGYLFRSHQQINNKTELLVFITPKILSEGLKVD